MESQHFGNKRGNDLSGLLKIKLKAAGLCVVYQAVRRGNQMLIIVIGARADEDVYEIAQTRKDSAYLESGSK